MAKQKAPTPQELYQQRRLREEQERTAYLPPGLINHGNTCFMNSVLQGLIATRLLSDLVHFAPIPPAVQERSSALLAGQRSPQLTNGHHLSGPYEQSWVNSMPIGDVFLSVMYKAWDLQARRQREILSPRSILGTLGQKYDQYLDFAQQDAHEFLRILLDAMRMEELDIIKKRQPPSPPPPKKRRRSTIVPVKASNPQGSDEVAPPEEPVEIPEDEKLMSFVDMIFGGRLTSILVCQKCKNISQTYEDFNDISLSIKPEDYVHRKRDKFKNFAKRFTNFPSGPNSISTPTLLNPMEIQRPSSVPPSPKERPEGQLIPRDEPPPSSTVRRRSLDIPSDARESEKPVEGNEGEGEKKDEESGSSGEATAATESDSDHVLVNVTGPEGKRVEFIEVSSKPEKKKEDNWAKLGRRLSLGLGKSKDRKSRSEEKAAHRISAPIIEGVALDVVDESKSKRVSTDSPTPRASFSNAVSLLTGRTSPSPKVPSTESPRPSIDPQLTPTPTPSSASFHPTPSVPRSKSPKPPKANAAEAEYLRKILADVSTGSSNPLSTLFRPQSHHLHPLHHTKGLASQALSQHNVWLGMNQFTGIEECLRMFTAVEVLDGENMVGCRRCWKIANGLYPKRKAGGEDVPQEEEEDSDSVENEPSPPILQENGLVSDDDKTPLVERTINMRPPPVPHIPTSISTPTVSFFVETEQPDKIDTRSISSLPTGVPADDPATANTIGSADHSPRVSRTNSEGESFESARTTPGGLPIPLISTTGPDLSTESEPPSTAPSIVESLEGPAPSEASAGEDNTLYQATTNGIVAPKPTRPTNHLVNAATVNSKDSLPVPVPSHRGGGKKQGDGMTTDEDDSSADESDTSIGTSISAGSTGTKSDVSTASSSARPPVPPGLESIPRSEPTHGQGGSNSGAAPPAKKKPSKPKPVIMRPAYKRYLIATPPPVLVVHLKRFQQLAKSPFLSFSHGFKKLDDYITFPEYLDLTPFLAPKKEDYGLGKKKKDKDKSRESRDSKEKGKGKAAEERCMYRLYAVVVHIGNMLGGHYIAYAALPSRSPIEGEGLATRAKSLELKQQQKQKQLAQAANSAQSVNSNSPQATPGPPESAAAASPPPPARSSSSSSSSSKPLASATTTDLPSTPEQPSQQRQWAYISDTIVRLTTLEEVLSAKAYICMYERC